MYLPYRPDSSRRTIYAMLYLHSFVACAKSKQTIDNNQGYTRFGLYRITVKLFSRNSPFLFLRSSL